MNEISQIIIENTINGKIDKNIATEILKRILKAQPNNQNKDIAIIGIHANMPKSRDIEELWSNISKGRDCISKFPKKREEDTNNLLCCINSRRGKLEYCEGGYLDEIDKFDYNFFKLSPQEARLMDPSQRLFLETAYGVLENSGYGGEKLKGSKTGVFVGVASWPLYAQYISQVEPESMPISVAGNVSSIIASRISYIFDLKGPSMVLDTACSSSLVAVHLACQSIRNGECKQAIAGGIKLNMFHTEDLVKIGIESSDYRTRAFDNDSDGTSWGEGVGAVLLKPLSKALRDNDYIYAVIKGSAINQDGASVGITAPNAAAQEEVLINAWKDSGINPETISYIEAHGTGTKLGDPIEIESIQKAFGKYTGRKQFCAIGSIKTNIGHLDSAAGIASLLKAILALKHKKLPPTINFKTPNKRINFEESPVYVNTRLIDWTTDGNSRRCGVSAFGLGGTNCHIVLEEAPDVTKDQKAKNNKIQIFSLSAKSEGVLKELIQSYLTFLGREKELDLNELCYTANTGRGHYNYRLALMVKSIDELRFLLEKINSCKSLEEINTKCIYYGKHKLVTANKKVSGDRDITEEEIKKISLIVRTIISKKSEISTDNLNEESLLDEICDLYVKGAQIKWEDLYDGQIVSKIGLPVYAFERKRCWVDAGDSLVAQNVNISFNREQTVKTTIVLKGRETNNYSDLEKQIANIWGEVLGYSKLNIYDSFYELGGDSIYIMKVISKISEQCNVEISYTDFVKSNTIAELAVKISEKSSNGANNKLVYPSIKHDPINMYEPFPLTDVQMAYLMGRDAQIEMGGVSTHVYTEIETDINIALFNRSLQKVIMRHPMLHTIIHPNGTQQILKQVPDYKIVYEDISHLNSASQQEYIFNERERMSHYIFKTDCWPLFEFKALKLSPEKNYLLVGFDMLIADGFSIQIALKEILNFYNSPELQLPDMDITFRDYILAMKEFEKSSIYLNSKDYWLGKINEFPSSPALPLKNDLKEFEKPHFNRLNKVVKKEAWIKLKRKAQLNNVSPSALLCTAYAQVLSYWSNQNRLAINLTVFNRYPFHSDIDKVMGDFTSIIVLGVEMNPEDSFWEKARSVQSTLLESLEHRHFDGVAVIREISKRNNLGAKAIMPIVFTSLLFGDNNSDDIDIGSIKMSSSQTPQVYLDYQACENNGDLHINWDYVEQMFDNDVICMMFEHYTKLISSLIEDNNEYKFELGLRDRSVLDYYNNTDEIILPATLHRMFINQAIKVPENKAVEFGNESLTYKELHEKSNQVANYLIENGVKEGNLIGVLVKRSINTIVNILGIVKAGAAYVPIEPEYPLERREYIVKNSDCKFIIDPDYYKEHDICLFSKNDPGLEDKPQNVAYVIYTSGSTGRPKGVVITHQGAANTIIDINQKFKVDSNDRILGISSLCFDLSVYDVFGALSTGACLVIINDQRDVTDLIRKISEQKITIWNSVPAIMNMVTDNLDSDYKNDSLRLVLLSGDWIPLSLPQKVRNHFQNARLISLGGATEASIWSIYYPIEEVKDTWKSIPYGMPLANQKFYVLNYMGHLCAIGVQGELCIGGVGLAKGYMNDEEKTRNSFIEHPELGPLYRTGDYGVMHKEGYIEFLGRKDQQVKIKGYRIELGEIESCLLKHGSIINAVITDKTDKSGKKYLCAYFVSDVEISVPELRECLSKDLPEYMIPSYFVRLDEIPLTQNGKVDRKSLPDAEESINTGTEYVAPANEIEIFLVDVWKQVLSIEQIGINDNFFDIGGDSLLLMRVHAEIEKKYPAKVSVIDLFTYTTVVKIADFIQNGDESTYGNLTIQPIPFPSEFFSNRYEGGGSSNLRFSISGELLEGLSLISEKEKVTKHDVLLMIYMYLFAEISGKEEIVMQVMNDGSDKVHSLLVDLGKIGNFSEFFKTVQAKRQNEHSDFYKVKDIDKHKVNSDEMFILPLFYKKGPETGNVELLDFYDIIMGVDERSTCINFVCEYNQNKLKEEKVEELVNKYVKITKLILNDILSNKLS